MKRYTVTAIVLAVLALVSCRVEDLPREPAVDEIPVETTPDGQIVITAGFESWSNDTKTHVSGGTKILWSSGDNAIFVFDSKAGKNKFTSEETGPKETRSFTGTITDGSTIDYILWTGRGKNDTDNSAISLSPGGPLTGEDPTAGNEGTVVEWDQTKATAPLTKEIFSGSTLAVVNPQNISTTNTFASNANIAIMKRGDTALRSVFGYIRFTVPKGSDGNSAIKCVEFIADEYLSGLVRIDYSGDEPAATITGEGNNTLRVNMRWNAGTSRYEDGTLFAVLPAGTYTNFRIRVTPFADGASTQDAATGTPFTLTSARPVVVKRGKYTDCGQLPASKPGAGDVLGQVVQLLPKNTSAGGLFADTDNNILYAGMSGQINVYDITTPMAPKLLATAPLLGNARQITAYNGRLYVTARDTGTWIYDVSKPAQPKLIKRFDTVELATGVDVAGNCLFIGQRQNGVEFVDITSPSSPKHIRIIKTPESQSVFYRNGYLYSGEWTSGQVTIFDARDLGNISEVRKINLQGYGDGLWISGNYLYVSTGHHHRNETPKTVDGDGHGVEIWDITDLENPVFVSRTEFDIFYLSGIDYWLNRPSGDGNTLFCGDVYNGLYVLDITDKANPSILTHYTLSSGSAVTSMALATGVVYLATSKDGLQVIKCSRALPCTRDRGILPANASARYNYPTSSSRFIAWKPSGRGAVHSVASWGGYLFAGCGDAGLSVVKVTRGGSVTATTYTPSNSSDLPVLPYAGGVCVRGNKLYVSEGENGIGVYRLTEGSQGPVVRRIATILEELSDNPKNRFSCWVNVPNDKYVVNGARFAGYQFVATGGSPESPTYTYRGSRSQNLNYIKYISDQVCDGDRLPYATRDGLIWIDLSSTDEAPVSDLITDIKSDITNGVTNFTGGDALITRGTYFHRVESGSTSIAQSVNVGVNGLPRWDGSGTVMLTNHLGKTISKVDVSSFASPSVTYTEDTTGNPEPGIFMDGKAIIPCGYQGLLIEK